MNAGSLIPKQIAALLAALFLMMTVATAATASHAAQQCRTTLRDPLALRAILMLESEQGGMLRLRILADKGKTVLT